MKPISSSHKPQPSAPKAKAGAAAGKDKAAPQPAKEKFDLFRVLHLRALLEPEKASDDNVEDEADTRARYRRLMLLINTQALAIGLLVGILIFAAPVMRPVHQYYSQSPTRERQDLVGLFAPNLTGRAIMSWATVSVTEVMTVGFGDFDRQIRKQRGRFTSQGWTSFQAALANKQLRQSFKSQQLVLTTVPADIPVIVGEGVNEQYGYQWVVEVPIIMTFVTNNNVSRKERSIIRLTIVRVPAQESVGGIAIETWDLL